MKTKGFKVLFIIIVINILVTMVHYIDNIIYLDEYPDPEWMTGHIIDAFWFVMTPFSIIGYILLKKRKTTIGAICLYIYSIMSLLVLSHYLIAPIWEISLKINSFILLEALSAVFLISYVSYFLVSNKHERSYG